MTPERLAEIENMYHRGPIGSDDVRALLSEIATLRDDLEAWKDIVRELFDEWSEENGAVCDRSCCADEHSDRCKAVYITEHLKALREVVK